MHQLNKRLYCKDIPNTALAVQKIGKVSNKDLGKVWSCCFLLTHSILLYCFLPLQRDRALVELFHIPALLCKEWAQDNSKVPNISRNWIL